MSGSRWYSTTRRAICNTRNPLGARRSSRNTARRSWPSGWWCSSTKTDAAASRYFLLGWRHSGFSAHNEVRAPAEDAEGRTKLARYMLRAPMSLENLRAKAATTLYHRPPRTAPTLKLVQFTAPAQILPQPAQFL